MSTKQYLGDGVYVEFDRGGLVLTTENGVTVSNQIFLEQQVYEALTRFVATLVPTPAEEPAPRRPISESQDMVVIQATCLNESTKALRVLVKDNEAWVPKSQLSVKSKVRAAGDAGDLVVPTWLAEKKGWIDAPEEKGPFNDDDFGADPWDPDIGDR